MTTTRILSTCDRPLSILDDHATLVHRRCGTVDITMELSDPSTERIVKGFIEQVEKHQWMLSAFTK